MRQRLSKGLVGVDAPSEYLEKTKQPRPAGTIRPLVRAFYTAHAKRGVASLALRCLNTRPSAISQCKVFTAAGPRAGSVMPVGDAVLRALREKLGETG